MKSEPVKSFGANRTQGNKALILALRLAHELDENKPRVVHGIPQCFDEPEIYWRHTGASTDCLCQ